MNRYVPGTKILKPRCPLEGEDGNAFFIIGRARRALKRAGVPSDIIEEYSVKCTHGDYDNVIRTTMQYTKEDE